MQREIFRFLSLWQNVAFFAHCYGPECGWGFLFKAKRRHPDDGALFSSICLCSIVGSLPMSSIQSALIFCGLMLAVALTIAWDGFLSYEVLKLAEFVF